MAKAIIFDLDMTLVDTSVTEELRTAGDWDNVYANIQNMNVYFRIMYYLQELMRLKVPTAIVSNSPSSSCQNVLEALNISKSDIGIVKQNEELPKNKRVYVLGYRSTEHHKPNPEPVDKALSAMYMSYRKSEVIAFGDTEEDVTAYINAGIPVSNIYRVTWYTHEFIFAGQTRAGHVLTNIEELDDVIAGISHECLADVSRDYTISFTKNGDDMHYLDNNGNDIVLEANKTERSVRAFQQTVLRDRRSILSLEPYIPSRYAEYAFGLLPEMETMMESVINLKNGVSEAIESYAKRFANVIVLEDAHRLTSYDTIALISVPSSKVEGDANSPIKECIRMIVPMLNSRGFNAVNLSNTFVRNTDIRSAHDALRNGQERPSVSEQLETITYNAPELTGKVLYFILDDVTTQGRIMNDVCKKTMTDSGIDAKDIVCLVAGKTMSPNMNVTRMNVTEELS